jgi:PTS system nitrogen regulatory IIA component
MELGDLIKPEAVVASLRAQNKKQALHELANKAAELTGIHARKIFEVLLQRERLSSTGIGRGIAIPHARLPGLVRIVSVFARLESPIPFEAHDGEDVDLIFLLLAPEDAGADHLKALARLSRLLREPSTIQKLRAARDRAALYSVLTEPVASHAA